MSATLVNLFPYILASAIVPVQIIVTLFFLKDPQVGLQKASLFVAGTSTARLIQGVIFGVVLNVGVTDATNGKGPVITTLLLVLGILLLITAYKKIMKEEDPDGDPPKWVDIIDSATSFKALTLGLQIPLISLKLWVFTLSAIGTIGAAQLAQPASFLTYIVFLILSQIFLILPLGFRLLSPRQTIQRLDVIYFWLMQNYRIITILVSLLFGVYFLWQGIAGFSG